MYRYESLAGEFEDAIAKGVFPVGARLPSIRQTCARHGVSMATVMEAYARLEERGLIEAKAKSGHFVKPPARASHVLGTSRPKQRPGAVAVARIAMDVLEATGRPGMVPLGAGVPDGRMLPVAELARCQARAARVHAGLMARYEQPAGARSLREAISRHLVDGGCAIGADDIVISNGGQEALILALSATCSAGDVVAVETPTYFGVLKALEALGLRALELPTHPRRGVDLDALEEAARGGGIRACVLMPTFQNPLGFRMTDPDKRHAVEMLARYGVPLIEDDVMGALGLEAPRPLVAKSFDVTGNVILCGSYSKTVSPALRLGWLAPGRFGEEISRRKFLLNIATGTIPQLALADFLKGNRFRRATRAAARTYARRIQAMRDAVIEHFPQGTTCSTPVGGFFLWVEMAKQYDAMALYERALARGISISPGRLFNQRARGNRNCFRLSCAAIDDGEIAGAVTTLAKLARSCRD
ncbi:MAG: PLP-dependent aminotransferase family protein [Alphaproteobacteria bacterium]